jgi:septum site-determining protein MinC
VDVTTGNVTIKGTREGLLVALGGGEWEALLDELAERLELTATFFQGGRVTLQVGDRELPREGIQAIVELLAQHGIALESVLSTAAETRQAAQGLGFRTASKPQVDRPPRRIERESVGGLLVRRTLRSGQVIHHPGHVVVIGDVNPGAEVVAGGDVVVWGRLRGLVHAGAMGDDEALVCALSLAPTQLRIGNHIARSPDEEGQGDQPPEMACVREGRIVVEPWQ